MNILFIRYFGDDDFRILNKLNNLAKTIVVVKDEESYQEKLPFIYTYKEFLEVYRRLNYKCIISYAFPKKLPIDVLKRAQDYSINFHPAPLPHYRGAGNYIKAILEDLNIWGVTAHHMDEEIDNGAIIQVRKFDIPANSTYASLEKLAFEEMWVLFLDVLENIKKGDVPSYFNDREKAEVLTRRKIQEMKRIDIGKLQTMNKVELDRKIRSLWCPPYSGAYIEIDGQEYTLITKEILQGLKR